jgi:general L-amino acid transport system permease protein
MPAPKSRPARAPRLGWGTAAGWLGQAVLLGLVVALIAWLAGNASVNMADRGMTSGFGFLGRPAGFDIAQHLIPYSPNDSFARVYLVGALNTLLVSGLGIVTATVLGLLVGTARVSRNYLARAVATGYVEVVRNIPLPIQLLVWFSVMILAPPPHRALGIKGWVFLSNRGLYLPKPLWNGEGGLAALGLAVSVILGVGLSLWFGRKRAETGRGLAPAWGWAVTTGGAVLSLVLTGNPTGFDMPRFAGFDFTGGLNLSPSLVALWAGLSVYTAGFIGELVRGGLTAVASGQGEAARSLGLSEGQTLRLVVLPQALRVIVPPLASQYLNLTKNSSLAVIVGYQDLLALFGGTTLNQTGQSIETLALVMAFYLTVSLSISGLMNLWNARSAAWAAAR